MTLKRRRNSATCPHCQAKVAESAFLHGMSKIGLPWAGEYALFECGLMLVQVHGKLELWNICERLQGVSPGAKIVDVELVSSRLLTPEELAARRREEENKLAEWSSRGRFRFVRSPFDNSTTGSTSTSFVY